MSLKVWSYFVLQKALYEMDLNLYFCYCIFFFGICEKWGGMGGDKNAAQNIDYWKTWDTWTAQDRFETGYIAFNAFDNIEPDP